MDNRTELAKADSLIAELTGDSYIVVDSIRIIGYASPEGKYDYNTRLSGERAEALKRYLERVYTPKGYILTTSAASEDWDGLYKASATVVCRTVPEYYPL
ncbi:MAG: OmpA family protein [Bacteroides sp.]|nr:OmpA family protein [Bacteroides sp.]